MPVGTRRGIPEATVARLPVYHRVLTSLNEVGVATVSSEELANASGVSSAKLRKDLSHLGSYGTRGVGYDVEFLVYQIARELGLTQDWPVVIVGVGNLGRALAHYGGFASRGFRIVGLLDADPNLVGKDVAIAPGLRVRHLDELERVAREAEPAIAVIATPAEAAQSVCDRVVAAGDGTAGDGSAVVDQVRGDEHAELVGEHPDSGQGRRAEGRRWRGGLRGRRCWGGFRGRWSGGRAAGLGQGGRGGRGPGDRHGAVEQILDGVVGTTMSELHLVSVAANSAAKDLISKTDAKDGLLPDEFADGINDSIESRWIAWSGAQEDAVGSPIQNLVGACGGR